MRLLSDLLSDLVERRLWPVALLLVAALVAVPLVLAKSPAEETAGETDPPPAAVAAAAAVLDASAEDAVVTAGAAPQAAPLRGHEKNPFRQQHVPPKQETEAGGTPPAAGSGSTGGGGSGTGGAPTTPQKVYLRAAIDVRFGKAIGTKRMIADVPRLTPLPSPARPIVVFLGMRKDLETAVFLISTDVHAQGDGSCVPSRKLCEAIELKKGDVAFLDVSAADGTVDQFELELVDVRVEQTTSKEAAQAAYARTSRAGARILRRRAAKAAANTSAKPFRVPFRYAQERGYLHIAPYVSRRLRGGGAAAGAASRVEAVTDVRGIAQP